MTDIPILYQPEMVYGIECGHKTMTRRLPTMGEPGGRQTESAWAKVKVGDRLWVREQHWRWGKWNERTPAFPATKRRKAKRATYRFEPLPATLGNIYFGTKTPPGRVGFVADGQPGWFRRPSIFLPKEHSRYTLIVTDVKRELLQAISEKDCEREGCVWDMSGDASVWYVPDAKLPHTATGRECFRNLWIKINGSEAWESNPEVVAIGFRVIKQNIGSVELEKAA